MAKTKQEKMINVPYEVLVYPAKDSIVIDPQTYAIIYNNFKDISIMPIKTIINLPIPESEYKKIKDAEKNKEKQQKKEEPIEELDIEDKEWNT